MDITNNKQIPDPLHAANTIDVDIIIFKNPPTHPTSRFLPIQGVNFDSDSTWIIPNLDSESVGEITPSFDGLKSAN